MKISNLSACLPLATILFLCLGAVERPRPATQPAATFRMVRQTVAGLAPAQWVFVIVTPERYVWVTASPKLRWCIEQAVPAGSTLEWVPSGKRIEGGDEPLNTDRELDELKAFCEEHHIRFVHIPH